MNRLLILVSCAVLMLTACDPKKQASGQAEFKLPAVDDIAMYQVNPRVFAPQQSLLAVAQRIDSIQALGVNVMWVMPIYPIGVEKGKNSPYCISDYCAVAPEFGTIDDFKHLAQVCHEHQMAIILDWVANHTAWDHPWFSQHPDWYTHDEKTDTVVHPPFTDWYDVAELNYDNSDMRRAMIDAMKFWIVEVGIDGFRCDVADGVPADFWKEAIDELRQAAAPRSIVMLAEGKNVDNFTVGGFDMNYGWDYKDALLRVFRDGRPASDLVKADSAEYAQLPAGKVKLRFTTNHDHSNEVTPVVEFTNERGSMAAYVASVFLHGGALIYGSQEVGYPNPINFFKYVPVDWTANPNLYKEYQALIALYNSHPALRKGQLTAWATDDALFFEKSLDGERFLVFVNVRNNPVVVDIPETWKGQKVTNVMGGEQPALENTLELPPFAYLILQSVTD
ncbi:MAG: alpha-glucosidase C-terminal domain-containing protein [Prevotella sp.]|nr:alpha-glucosidase C-terminal domain-containing protein [Prevotella sp.]